MPVTMPVKLRRNVLVRGHGKSAWMHIVSVWKKRLLPRNRLLALVLDDLLRLGTCAEMPDGLSAEVSSDAYVFSVSTT